MTATKILPDPPCSLWGGGGANLLQPPEAMGHSEALTSSLRKEVRRILILPEHLTVPKPRVFQV